MPRLVECKPVPHCKIFEFFAKCSTYGVAVLPLSYYYIRCPSQHRAWWVRPRSADRDGWPRPWRSSPAGADWSAAVAPTDGGTFEGNRPGTWPVACGWLAHDASDGAITPLLSIRDIAAEGTDMNNCLARGYYHDRAASGEVHVFKLRLPSGEATLAVEEHRDASSNGRRRGYTATEDVYIAGGGQRHCRDAVKPRE